MKIIIYIVSYFILGIGYYLLFSIVGVLLGYNYLDVIHTEGWFAFYVMALHWWLCILSLMPYYDKHVAPYFKD